MQHFLHYQLRLHLRMGAHRVPSVLRLCRNNAAGPGTSRSLKSLPGDRPHDGSEFLGPCPGRGSLYPPYLPHHGLRSQRKASLVRNSRGLYTDGIFLGMPGVFHHSASSAPKIPAMAPSTEASAAFRALRGDTGLSGNTGSHTTSTLERSASCR